MKLYELLLGSYPEIQGEYVVCYYDYDTNERIILDDDQIKAVEYATVKYLYCEDDVLFIEVDDEDAKEALAELTIV